MMAFSLPRGSIACSAVAAAILISFIRRYKKNPPQQTKNNKTKKLIPINHYMGFKKKYFHYLKPVDTPSYHWDDVLLKQSAKTEKKYFSPVYKNMIKKYSKKQK